MAVTLCPGFANHQLDSTGSAVETEVNINRRVMLGRLLGGSAAIELRAAGNSESVEVGGSTLDVEIDSDTFQLSRTALLDWVMRSAKAVTAYFGRFPVARARVHITASQFDRVSNGVSFGDGGPRCRISVGRHSTLAALYNDWVLTHEMIHFSFPSVEDRHRWIEEGIATYVEPIARASVGILTAERVWADMLQNMSQGLPQAGDRGLDQTHTWARTYWGGALFCLVADVEIRRRTGNSKGLRDALRAINRAGGTIDVDWSLERAFAIGDKATDGGTLMELYGHMATKPGTVDLPLMWTQLGVVSTGQAVVLDDHAPWAAIRSGIC
jgi:hypothetical protein